MEPKIVAPNDTIFALSSGPGLAGVAVIRVSGPGTRDALEALVRRRAPSPPCAPCATSARRGAKLDRGLVLWFPAPRASPARTWPNSTCMAAAP